MLINKIMKKLILTLALVLAIFSCIKIEYTNLPVKSVDSLIQSHSWKTDLRKPPVISTVVKIDTIVIRDTILIIRTDTIHIIKTDTIVKINTVTNNVTNTITRIDTIIKTNTITRIDTVYITIPTVTDIDGNIYKTVKIGTQVWMQENLKVGRLNDGTLIPFVPDSYSWAYGGGIGYSWYEYDMSSPYKEYGAYYRWGAVNTGKLCPVGWHVPSIDEWNLLVTYLGGESVAGVKMREVGTVHWDTSNPLITNSSGFTALGAGFCSGQRNGILPAPPTSGFSPLKIQAIWWTSTMKIELNEILTFGFGITGSLGTGVSPTYPGYSVRCLKN